MIKIGLPSFLKPIDRFRIKLNNLANHAQLSKSWVMEILSGPSLKTFA